MREQLLDFLKRELIGPDPIPPLVQDNGELPSLMEQQ